MSFAIRLLLILFAVSLLAPGRLAAQSLTGTVRGTVHDRYTQRPLEAVQVQVLLPGRQLGALTDSLGRFRIEGIPVGRYDLNFERRDYLAYTQTGVLIGSNKEVQVEIALEERIFQMNTVNLYPTRRKGAARNEMAALSALSFDVEETRKFAGGLDDPTRVAGNFPGIVASQFTSENFISVRGNSPRGLLYRLEGIDIPNPNHFARIGSSGGTFTIFSQQLLANSDFFIGAFPAEYGNATAGVFDVHFRNGNHERREFAVQAGVLGVDLAAEGPLSARRRGSYLVNYRYATLNFAKHLIGYTSVPTYHDLSFKINLPTDKAGTFSIFGIAGLSNRLVSEQRDSSLWTRDLDRFRLLLRSDMAAMGITHTYLIKERTLVKSTLLGAFSLQRDNKDYFELDGVLRPRDYNEYTRQPLSFTTSVKHTFSRRHTNKTGVIVSSTWHKYFAQIYDYVENRQDLLADEQDRTLTVQAYSQSQLRLSPKFTLNAGLHYLYFDLTRDQSLEPRLSLHWQLDPRQSLAFGYGLHSRIEDYGTYVTRLEVNGQPMRPNLDLGFLKTHHLVLGYEAMLSDHLRFRSEAYYQHLFDVPVEAEGTYSVINLNELDQLRILVNGGTARNYGLDLGLERFSRRGLYYLLNASLFNSTYTDIRGQRHNSAFNGNYKGHLLMGKEFRTGRRRGGNSMLGVNTTLSLIGGRYYTPVDLEASRLARETVLDESRPFSEQDPALFIADISITLHTNKPRYSGTWALQIKNIFQSAAPDYREYDATLDQVVELAGAGFLPVMSYKIEF
ncbi:MAG: TonB-dependent receptor [Bacteroidia bacterium]|nr:TonB-dependent receptor [Bacteroidia bacterium]